MDFNYENFQTAVLESQKPVLIDFWAPWCHPCRIQAPILSELADEMAEEAVIGKVNVDENDELAVEYGILSIPSMLVFKDGKVVSSVVGITPKKELLAMLQEHIH